MPANGSGTENGTAGRAHRDETQDRAKAELLDAAVAEARRRGHVHGEQLAVLETFVRQYYRFVAPEDLVGRDPIDVRGAALSQLELAEQRTPGTALVRVLSPTSDGDG